MSLPITDVRALFAQMEADAARVREQRAALQQQEEALETTIRTLKAYLGQAAATPAPPVAAQPTPSAVQNPTPRPDATQAVSRWEGVSIRQAALDMLRAAHGGRVSAQHIAETLLREGFPYSGKDAPRAVPRFRETIASVLLPHIKGDVLPKLERPAPATYVLPVGSEEERTIEAAQLEPAYDQRAVSAEAPPALWPATPDRSEAA